MLGLLILTSILTTIVSAISEHNNVALYWGQNSAGTQTDLASYCKSEDADIFILSFVDIFGYSYPTQVNFANMCGDTYSDGLLHCSSIGEDIKTCQNLGKTILLSLGGASGAYGFADNKSAEEFALTLWNMFGAGSDSSVERPFDDAIVDGFDFDIENNVPTGYAALATKLRTYFATDNSKTYYLSAAPQCPYPDASVGDLLENAYIDFAFIQFYNNYCSTLGTNFNWNVWADFAKNVSPNKNIKLFLGLPAASGAAGSGYATIDHIKNTFDTYIYNNEDSNFAGFVLWDASWSRTNQINGNSFGDNLQQILDNAYNSGGIVENTTSTTSTTSSTSTTSTTTSTTPTTTPSTSTTTTSTSTTPTTSSTTPTTTSTANTVTTESTSVGPVVPHTTIKTVTTSSSSLSLPSESDNNKNVVPSSTSTSPASSSTDCSNLNGLAKAQCLNNNFKNGLYLNQGTCTSGQIACAADGSFAMCNFGNWVSMQCASGTTCYASNYGDQVDIGCNFIDSKAKFEKRSNKEGLFSFFKRYI